MEKRLKSKTNLVVLLLFVVYLISVFCVAGVVSAGEKEYSVQTTTGQTESFTLDKLIISLKVSVENKRTVVLQVMKDKEATQDQVKLAVSYKIITTTERDDYLLNVGESAGTSAWTYNGQTLDQIINDNALGNRTKQVVIEKAYLEKEISPDQINSAHEKGIITLNQRNEYLHGKGLFGVIFDFWDKSVFPITKGVSSFVGGIFGFGTFGENIGKGVSALLYALIIDAWMILFFVVNPKAIISNFNPNMPYSERLKAIFYIKSFLGVLILTPIIYGIGMALPIINRFLQLITFELLGLNGFLRSILLAMVIYFVYVFWGEYRKYKKRRYAYYKTIEEAASRELDKIQLGR